MNNKLPKLLLLLAALTLLQTTACQRELDNQPDAPYRIVGIWQLLRIDTRETIDNQPQEPKTQILPDNDIRKWKLSSNRTYRTEAVLGNATPEVTVGKWELEGINFDSALLVKPANQEAITYLVERLTQESMVLDRETTEYHIDELTNDTLVHLTSQRLTFRKVPR
jgi:hypothetical protein